MHIHSSSCLAGPVSCARPWWRGLAPADEARPQDDDPTFRADLVARIRRQIAEGTYGTDEQLEQALERLLKEASGAA